MMPPESILLLSVLPIMSYAAWYDIKRRIIQIWVPISLIITVFILKAFVFSIPLLPGLLYAAPILIASFFLPETKHFGGGDMKLLVAIAFLFGSPSFFWFALAAFLFSLAGSVITQQKYVPFVPSVLLASIGWILFTVIM